MKFFVMYNVFPDTWCILKTSEFLDEMKIQWFNSEEEAIETARKDLSGCDLFKVFDIEIDGNLFITC